MRRDPTDAGHARRVVVGSAHLEFIETQRVSGHILVVDQIVTDEHVHQSQRECPIGAGQRGDMDMALFRGQRTIGIDGHERGALALRLLRPCPKMHARGDGVRTPENDQLRLIREFHVDAEARPQGQLVACRPRGGADRTVQQAGTQLVKEPLGHRLPLDQAHRAGIAVGQDLFRVIGRNGRESIPDAGDGLVPADAFETALALRSHAPQRMDQPIGVVGALRIARDLGAQHAGGGRMRGGTGYLARHAILDMHLECTRIRTVVGTCALDDRHRGRGRRGCAVGADCRAHAGAYPVSKMRFMKASHCANWSRATNSFGRWASAISPGPQITLGTPIC